MTDMTPIATKAVGIWGTPITYSTVLLLTLNTLIGGALVAVVKSWPKLKELANLRRKDELDLMSDRVALLEAKLDQREAEHAAEMAVMRHRTNNLAQCLDAILLLIEAAPTKAADHVKKIREMRAKQEIAEATEKATVSAAKINAAGAP